MTSVAHISERVVEIEVEQVRTIENEKGAIFLANLLHRLKVPWHSRDTSESLFQSRQQV